MCVREVGFECACVCVRWAVCMHVCVCKREVGCVSAYVSVSERSEMRACMCVFV